MINRRNILALGAASALAACAKPLVEERVAQDINVSGVTVTLSSEFPGLQGGRKVVVSEEQLVADVKSSLTSSLLGQGGGDRDVLVQVTIGRVFLISPGAALLYANTNSTIVGALQVVDAKTGEMIVTPKRVAGTGDGLGGGIIGALARPSPEKDYANVVESFGEDVKKRLFGK